MAEAGRPLASKARQGGWSIDDAFQYLTRLHGFRDYEALYQLNEYLRAGRLHIDCRYFDVPEACRRGPKSRKGVLKGWGTVRPTFWQDQLAVDIALPNLPSCIDASNPLS